MHLVLLPGNSKYNKEWIDEVRDYLGDLFVSTHVLYYDHWFVEEDIEIDLEVEQKKLLAIVENLDEYVIFAKSAGSLVTIKSIHEKLIEPKFCIFTGHPVNWARYRNYPVEQWIKDYAIPTLFIQKTTDPVFSFKELGEYLQLHNVQNLKLVEQEGDDHHYSDLALLRSEIEAFLGDELN
jgi:hypothetical protein